MKIRVYSNASDVSRWMKAIARDQLPFATSRSINETAKAFQTHQREHQRRAFILRGRGAGFFDRAIKIRPFSTKASLAAVVRVEPPGGEARNPVIVRHESDAERRPERSKSLVVPVAARPSPSSLVPASLKPRRLDLKRIGSSASGTKVYRGKAGTFAFRRSDGSGAILQRRGGEVRTLFVLVPRTDLDQRLDFHENAVDVVVRVWPQKFVESWDLALKTAK